MRFVLLLALLALCGCRQVLDIRDGQQVTETTDASSGGGGGAPADTTPVVLTVVFQCRGDVGGATGYELLVAPNGQLIFQRFDGGVVQPVSSSHALSIGSYHHVVASYDGGQIYVVVDGMANSATSTVMIGDHLGNLAFGRALIPTGYGDLVGDIDDVSVFTRSLLEQEVTAHIAAAK